MRSMAKQTQKVLGIHAPTVRPTAYAALLVAVGLSVPTFFVLTVIDILW